jgi:hypothetical protein
MQPACTTCISFSLVVGLQGLTGGIFNDFSFFPLELGWTITTATESLLVSQL